MKFKALRIGEKLVISLGKKYAKLVPNYSYIELEINNLKNLEKRVKYK